MKQEDKELLLRDLCARLTYGVIAKSSIIIDGNTVEGEITSCVPFGDGFVSIGFIEIPVIKIKPYLRPLSSMTKEEREIYNSFFWNHYHDWDGHSTCTECVKFEELPDFLIFCYKHHLDIWGLIPMGLALKAPEDMYKTE